jgi:thiol-disulfide isomerase/thioredoxin
MRSSPIKVYTTTIGTALALVAPFLWAIGSSSSLIEAADQPAAGRPFASLDQLEESYARQALDLDRRKIGDLAALGARLSGVEADRAFRAAFDLAVHRGLYQDAEPAARAYLQRDKIEYEPEALAASILLISRADRGEFDQSLADLKTLLASIAAAQVPDQRRLPAPLVCAIGESYLQRLVQGGRLDIAKEACKLGTSTNHPDSVVADYFNRRLARLEMVGKPAPAIEGTDVDGRPVRLADLKGKVVLVEFWASWCPPCVGEFAEIGELYRTHRDKGFAVIGVNVDALGNEPGGGKKPDAKEVLSTVRWFLLHHRAAWPSLFGESTESVAKAYGVHDVPAEFLIGRDGNIIQVELSGQALSAAIEKALH